MKRRCWNDADIPQYRMHRSSDCNSVTSVHLVMISWMMNDTYTLEIVRFTVNSRLEKMLWPKPLVAVLVLPPLSSRSQCAVFDGKRNRIIFTARLHVMQRTILQRQYYEAVLSVCPTVCLSNACCDKTKETCAHILIPRERSFVLVFW